jgi:hypothetical protein
MGGQRRASFTHGGILAALIDLHKADMPVVLRNVRFWR